MKKKTQEIQNRKAVKHISRKEKVLLPTFNIKIPEPKETVIKTSSNKVKLNLLKYTELTTVLKQMVSP